MRLHSRRFARIALLAALFLSPAPASRAGDPISIRTGERGTGVRVVLDLGGAIVCRLVGPSAEGGWGVVLKDACSKKLPGAIRDPHPLISFIETRCDGGDLRVDLRVRRPLDANAFSLGAGGGKPGRFVVDLMPRADAPPGHAPGAGPSATPAAIPEADPLPVETEPLPRRSGKWRIVLDPGHGGGDPGAARGALKEKELVLDVARRAAGMLNETGRFEARLTRSDDRLIALRRRFAIAEETEADAFVSIHVNASKTRRAYGVEVFFLSMGGASDEASRELARMENEADPDYVISEDSLMKEIPFLFDLRQSDTLLRSSRLAESILGCFEGSQLAASRGVKQAGFAVLKSFQIPSVLVELGFISNTQEAKRLKDARHRDRLARCVADGTIAYFRQFARARTESNTGDTP